MLQHIFAKVIFPSRADFLSSTYIFCLTRSLGITKFPTSHVEHEMFGPNHSKKILWSIESIVHTKFEALNTFFFYINFALFLFYIHKHMPSPFLSHIDSSFSLLLDCVTNLAPSFLFFDIKPNTFLSKVYFLTTKTNSKLHSSFCKAQEMHTWWSFWDEHTNSRPN